MQQYKKRGATDLRPDKSMMKIIACPMLAFESEVVTLKSCQPAKCQYCAGAVESDEDSTEGYVMCVFPRKIPIRGVRGE
jgi:hypothetical protein